MAVTQLPPSAKQGVQTVLNAGERLLGAKAATYEQQAMGAIGKNTLPGSSLGRSAAATLPINGGNDVISKGVSGAFAVQQYSFYGSIIASVVGGIASFLGLKSLQGWARKYGPSELLNKTVGEVTGVGAQVGNLVPEKVRAGLGSALKSAGDATAPLLNNAMPTSGNFVSRWLNGWAGKRGVRNALISENMYGNLQGHVSGYAKAVESLTDITPTLRGELLKDVSRMEGLLGKGLEGAASTQSAAELRGVMTQFHDKLHRAADMAQAPGYKNIGSGISNTAKSAGDGIKGLFAPGGFKKAFGGLFGKKALEAPVAGEIQHTARSLANHAGEMRQGVQQMAEKASAAGKGMTFGQWLGKRPEAIKNMTLQQGLTTAVQTGMFVIASKRAITQTSSALGKLKALHEDVTGEKIGTFKLMFSNKLPETVRIMRNNMYGSTMPSIIGNFALYAGTMIFQRRMNIMQLLAIQGLGGTVLNTVVKEDLALNNYVDLVKKHDAGEAVTPQEFVDLLASMDKKSAKTGKMHGGEVSVSDVAYYLSFNNVAPHDAVRMIEESYKNPNAAAEWAASAKATIAEHQAQQQQAAQPETPTLGMQAAAQVAQTERRTVQGDGVFTGKLVKEDMARAHAPAGMVHA